MTHPCKRCRQSFASPEKLAHHLKVAHGGQANSDPRVRIAVGIGAVALVAGLLVVLALQGDEAEPELGATRQSNFEALGLADDPFLGDANADVVVVAYEAPKCVACQYFHNQVLPQLNASYFSQGQAVLFFSQFTAGYDFDYNGGIAQECAYREGGNGAFWYLTDLIYQEQGQYTAGNVGSFLSRVAAERGLDEQTLIDCYENRETAHLVDADWQLAKQLSIRGTPSFIVFGASGDPVWATVNNLESTIQKLSH